jgi:hypothetical protein
MQLAALTPQHSHPPGQPWTEGPQGPLETYRSRGGSYINCWWNVCTVHGWYFHRGALNTWKDLNKQFPGWYPPEDTGHGSRMCHLPDSTNGYELYCPWGEITLKPAYYERSVWYWYVAVHTQPTMINTCCHVVVEHFSKFTVYPAKGHTTLEPASIFYTFTRYGSSRNLFGSGFGPYFRGNQVPQLWWAKTCLFSDRHESNGVGVCNKKILGLARCLMFDKRFET